MTPPIKSNYQPHGSLLRRSIQWLLGAAGVLAIVGVIMQPSVHRWRVGYHVSRALKHAAPWQRQVEKQVASGVDIGTLTGQLAGMEPQGDADDPAIEAQSGSIVIHFSARDLPEIASTTLALVAARDQQGGVVWICGRASPPAHIRKLPVPGYAEFTTVPDQFLPARCRGAEVVLVE